MKVILTENVPKLGEVGDVCDVADGFGRNYLLPGGFAMLATEGALKQIDDLKRAEARRQDRVRGETEALARQIEELDIEFIAKVGETGRLYGSITSSDIAAAIEEQIDIEIDRRKVFLDETLRTLGSHEVPIQLMPGVEAKAIVKITPDEEDLVQDMPVELADEEDDETAEGDEAGESSAGATADDGWADDEHDG